MIVVHKKVIVYLSLICYVAGAQVTDLQMPRSYISYKTNEKMVVDGNDNEAAWKEVSWSEPFLDIVGNSKPKFKTQLKMRWDDKYYYIFAKMEEPHVWANLTKRDTVIFNNNDFEVFIEPDNDTHDYYELELNALKEKRSRIEVKKKTGLEEPSPDAIEYRSLSEWLDAKLSTNNLELIFRQFQNSLKDWMNLKF